MSVRPVFLTRRTFIGSTIGGLTCSSLVGLSDSYARGDVSKSLGQITSYRFELDKIEVPKRSWLAKSQFPLDDKLIIDYDIGDNMTRRETYRSWNWQLLGVSFDIGDFAKLPMLGNLNYLHKVYKDLHYFTLMKTEME